MIIYDCWHVVDVRARDDEEENLSLFLFFFKNSRFEWLANYIIEEDQCINYVWAVNKALFRVGKCYCRSLAAQIPTLQ